MKLTLKTTSGLNPELCAGTFPLADEILMALEETFGSELEPEIEDIAVDVTSFTHRAVTKLLKRSLGVKWLPKGCDTIMEQSRAELAAMARERGYGLTLDEQFASVVHCATRVRELEVWKAEQTVIRRAQRHYWKEETKKQDVNGKRQWRDAWAFEFPPLKQSEGKSLQHEDARYAVKLPDGTIYDLGMTQGIHRPILSSGPDIAMQRIAKRAGLDIRGGAHTILQALTGYKDILPAYMTVWARNQWLVIVGWQKDPKLTPSSYYLADGQLTRSGEPDERLTLSELDYHLLKGSAETEIWDITEEVVVDHMNEDEELVMEGFMRDENEEAVPFDNGLMLAAAEVLGLSHEFRDGSAVWNHPQLYSALAAVLNERRAECRQHRTLIRALKDTNTKLFHRCYGASEEAKAEIKLAMSQNFREMNRLRSRIHHLRVSFKEQLADLESQAVLIHDSPAKYWVRNEAPGFGRMKGYMDHAPLMEPVRTTPAMHVSPANTVSITETITEVTTITKRTTEMRVVKAGKWLVKGRNAQDGSLSVKHIPAKPQAPLSASNASPTLKAKLRAICREELERGTLEQEVADEFQKALDAALRSLR